jgi:hypothetical protein
MALNIASPFFKQFFDAPVESWHDNEVLWFYIRSEPMHDERRWIPAFAGMTPRVLCQPQKGLQSKNRGTGITLTTQLSCLGSSGNDHSSTVNLKFVILAKVGIQCLF